MKMHLMMIPVVTSLAACDPNCVAEQVSSKAADKLNDETGVSFYESTRDMNRPDDLRDDAGWYFSGATDAGRLVVTFVKSATTESLPQYRNISETTCSQAGDHAYLYRGGGQGTDELNGEVAVDGRTLHLTQLRARLPDAGMLALPDRDFSF
ncbi:MAG: hypothetical protein IPJ65_42495 [Archangiaceae bacterium]|nr:hypothetical protein [Archangiaceae bacterium]